MEQDIGILVEHIQKIGLGTFQNGIQGFHEQAIYDAYGCDSLSGLHQVQRNLRPYVVHMQQHFYTFTQRGWEIYNQQEDQSRP